MPAGRGRLTPAGSAGRDRGAPGSAGETSRRARLPVDRALAWRWLKLNTLTPDEQEAYGEQPGNRYPGIGPRAHASVLDGDGLTALVVGRFAPDRSVRRVRLVGRFTTARQRTFFDLPAPRAPGRHAVAVVGSNHVYAYTDGATLWLWNHRSGGRAYAVDGLHDLAISDQAVFGTDASDRVRMFGPIRRIAPPANDVPDPPDDGGVPPPNG